MLDLKSELSSINNNDTTFIDETKKDANEIKVGKSAWATKTGFSNETVYKKMNASSGKIMYHTHFCFKDWKQFDEDTKILQKSLNDNNLTLDRFGVSIDSSMALPEEMRSSTENHSALFFENEEDWKHLSSVDFSQVHLGDNMIGSPSSYDSCINALKAGVTTMGNISQFFGWDYEQFPNVEERTKNTIKAIAVMAAHKKDGALIHSNLDDGYGQATSKISELLGMAILEKYIVCDLLGATLAPSFGDDFHSPYKRLIMLSALSQLYDGDLVGSMLFENKLGRNKYKLKLNDSHLSECLLFDMAGQVHYKTGHAVTVMANEGLTENVKPVEIVEKLALAKELESYVPEILKVIDFEKIDKIAYQELQKGKHFSEAVLNAFSSYIDINNPYAVMLAIKKVGVKNLIDSFAYDNDAIETDFAHFEH